MADDLDDPAEDVEKVTIRPAEPWPVYNVDRARAEIIAMDLLTRGFSPYRVRHMTKLSSYNVRRLATIVAEEAASPAAPRIVCRTPASSPRPGCAGRPLLPRPAQQAEPEQMAFHLD